MRLHDGERQAWNDLYRCHIGLGSRAIQHREHMLKGSFTDRYDVVRLVWCEPHDDAESAIRCEKQLKEWRRAWKVELIQKTNPQWDDLFEQIWSEIQGQGH